MPKFKVVVLNNNANNFNHYYKPFLSKLLNLDISIVFIQLDFGLNLKIKEEISNFKNLNNNLEIIYFPVLEKKFSFYYHFKIKKILKYLSALDIKALFLSTEYYVFDRYLISFSTKKNIRIIILNNSILSPWVLDNYINKNEKITKLRIIVNITRYFLKANTYYKMISSFFNYTLMPLIIINNFFIKSKFDKRALFCSNRSDLIILHDELETNALKDLFNKSKMKIYNVPHPIINYVKRHNQISKNLLVLLGGYDQECTNKQVLLYYQTIINLKNKFDLNDIHIRLHPRTKSNIVWYKDLIKKLEIKNYKVVLHDIINQEPLLDSSKNYNFVLGPMTSGIKILSYTSNINIFCILNVYDPITIDKEYHLGKSNNIFFINSADDINNFSIKNLKNNSNFKYSFESFIYNYLKDI
tara:strand:+ start:1847 stop:3085 length:1239 start_codon:yes stop_codon:yes gene_type:complete